MSFIGIRSCFACTKKVYPMERVDADGMTFHKACLKCEKCKCILKLGNFASLSGKFYCKPHFKECFKAKGNYHSGFGEADIKAKWIPQSGGGEEPAPIGDGAFFGKGAFKRGTEQRPVSSIMPRRTEVVEVQTREAEDTSKTEHQIRKSLNPDSDSEQAKSKLEELKLRRQAALSKHSPTESTPSPEANGTDSATKAPPRRPNTITARLQMFQGAANSSQAQTSNARDELQRLKRPGSVSSIKARWEIPAFKQKDEQNETNHTEQNKPEPKVTPKRVEEPKAAAKVEEPKAAVKVEEPKAAVKVEEPKAVKVKEPKAAVKVEEPKTVVKVEEPKAAVKVEEPKAAVKVEEPKAVVKVEEPKAAVKVEEPKAVVKVVVAEKQESATPKVQPTKIEVTVVVPKKEDVSVEPKENGVEEVEENKSETREVQIEKKEIAQEVSKQINATEQADEERKKELAKIQEEETEIKEEQKKHEARRNVLKQEELKLLQLRKELLQDEKNLADKKSALNRRKLSLR